MKFLLTVLAISVVLGACSKEPVPPGPTPPPPGPIAGTKFSVRGPAIEIEGSLKPGTTTTVERAESAVKAAVSSLPKE